MIKKIMLILLTGTTVLSSATNLRVVSLNTNHCGFSVDRGIDKIAESILILDPDVVLLQEIRTVICINTILIRLPEYDSCQMDFFGAVAIIFKKTRFIVFADIYEGSNFLSYISWTHYKFCQLADNIIQKKMTFVNVHLSTLFYGPVMICDGQSQLPQLDLEQILDWTENTNRAYHLQNILESLRVKSTLDNKLVIFGGDFNAPSHLDYNNKTIDCGSQYRWPTSVLMEKYGFVDAFREMHPHASFKPGITWTIFDKYPQDRIDYIFYRSTNATSVRVKSAETYATMPLYQWPSDHYSVVVEFTIE